MSRNVARPSGRIAKARCLRSISLVLLALAAVFALWLLSVSLRAGPVPGCGGGDCSVVLASRWAKLFGVPVGLFGAAAYGVLIILGMRPLPPAAPAARIVGAMLVLLIPAAAVWFACVQIFILHAFCPWCTVTHALATAGAIFMAWTWRVDAAAARSPSSSRRGSAPADSRVATWRPALAGSTLALGFFVAAQVLGPRPAAPHLLTATMAPGFVGHSGDAPAASPPSRARDVEPAAPFHAGWAETNSPAADGSRRVRIHQGRFVLDPHDLPIFGSADARHLVVMVADYTCHYCRAAHRLLEKVRAEFDPADLGIITLPYQRGGDSEQIQRAMLAAWRIDPAIWNSVADEIYNERLELVPSSIREVLNRRLGTDRMEGSLRDNAAWIQSVLLMTRDVTAANREVAKSGSIPQFIIGQEVIVGAPSDEAEFLDLFAKHLGLVRSRMPELLLAKSKVSLGKVFAGTQQAVVVPFSNPGEAPVEVSRIGMPAGERILNGVHTPVPAGQTSAVEFTVTVPLEPGPFDRLVTLYSNARTSSMPVRVSGIAWKPLVLTPESLDFGRVDPDRGSTQAVVRVDLQEEARVVRVESQNPGFTAALREVTPGKQYEVRVRTTRSLGLGAQQGAILLEFADPIPPGWPHTVAFGARATVDRAVTVMPPRILLPSGALANERHHQVLVRCTDGMPGFEVRSAVLDGGPAFLQPEIHRAGTNEFVVQLTLPAGWTPPSGPALARLVMETSHPRYPTLEVPLVPQLQ